MTPEQQKSINELRDAGYAVIIWSPEEIGEADTDSVEDRMVESGWEIIAALQD